MRSRRGAIGALLGLALIAAACGGSTKEASTANTVDANIKGAVDNALNTTSAAPGAATTTTAAAPKVPASMDDWEKLWETERAAVVKKIKDGKFGKSGTAVTGPGDFKMDLSKCPQGWSDTEGLTDTEIKIGHTTALSGPLADYGNIAKAVQTELEFYGNRGLFKDSNGKTRKVNLIIKDDAYDSARTIPMVDELIDAEKVFAMWTLGSPNTMKTYDKLNQRCVPQPISMTGHPAWGDPVNHPWTTGQQMAYNTEAVLWGAFIEKRLSELGGKAKVAALVMNNDFGKSYDAGFKAFMAQSANKANIEYITETIEPTAPTIKDPMTTLASKSPNVFIAMTAGTSCTQSITESAENGMKEKVKYLFMPSVCKGQSQVGKEKVGGDGSSANAWWIVGGGAKDFNSPAYDNDVWIKAARQHLADKGIDYKASSALGAGSDRGWVMAQILAIAGQLDGGLTRTNMVLAIRSLDMSHPYMLPGVKFNMNGNKDAFLIEASEFAKYDSVKALWVQEGDLIELSGKSSNCVWDQATGVCKGA